MDQLEQQSACFEKIKVLCVNYRKDSSSRKTAEYLKKRLSSLENLWQEFHSRHERLLLELEDKGINYFVDNVYEKTNEMYVQMKKDITNRLADAENRKPHVTFDFAGTSTESDDKFDDNEYIQNLLNKQECNFNAIYRAMSKFNNSFRYERWELDDHLTTLKSKWDLIDKLHWEIDFKLKGSNDNYNKLFAEVEEKYDAIKKEINSEIWSTAHYQKSAPKIDIPEFSGSYKQWTSFKDLFLETIHKNPTINSAQKMQHLKTKLRGEAERLVQHLSVSADNYNSCWDILIQRYDNKRLQFSTFMNTMLNLPVIQNPDAYNLKKMHDVIIECLNGINNIDVDTTTWDPIIVHIMAQKLDSKTLSDYMKELEDHRELQKLQEFLSFLENQFMAYETLKSAKKNSTLSEKSSSNNKIYNKQNPVKKHYFGFNKTNNYHTIYGNCPYCSGGHVLMNCEKFLEMDTHKRINTVAKLQLCKNCLYSHGNEECTSTKTCKECNLKHHTLLHNVNKKPTNFTYRKQIPEQRPSTSTQQPTTNHLHCNNMEVLLTTIQLKIKAMNGTYVTLRALLDQGSQTNLITENAAQMLRLPRKKVNACITGIGSVSGECKGQLDLSCKSIHSDYSFQTHALIMNKLTNDLPTTTFQKTEWPHLKNLQLADPDYNISRPIDLLLGADVYSEIILDGVLKGNNLSPVAQQTQLGWILCGKMKKSFFCHVTLANIEEITRFWESEDIHSSKDLSKDDQCEQFYKDTLQRSTDGRYIVKMPLCPEYEDKLGKSKTTAISQYLQLEKRLSKNKKLKIMYQEFISEYAALGHMKPSRPIANKNSCYLPHHGVLRENSSTTKLRVVFNASQKTSSGYSLNNLMEKGANLQQDIQNLILKWRTYKYAFTADIEKMYRCIWLAEDQQHLQKIIWRNSAAEELREYQLCTVTYGTKAAPWLAMRTLKQLAIDDGHKFPEAAKIIQSQSYVDDVIGGHNSILEAQNLQRSLIELLSGAGMNLRKWTSNHPALYENLCEDQISTSNTFDFKNEQYSKTLGLGWHPGSDNFHFNWPVKQSNKINTKRALLSDISKFYDPLGWLSPITVTAKLLFQRLWMTHLNWDDEVPCDIQSDWLKLKNELNLTKNIKIKRWIGDIQGQVELIGFCDASEKAYACCIYTRVINHGQPTITLLVAKTRVASLTQKTSLPRLELCAALLLANLMAKTKEALCEYNLSIQAWSDSQVVLAWLQGDSSRWEVYVRNRVTKIKGVIPVENYQENIKQLYEVITIKARVTKSYFLFEIHIPLVSNEDFMLYRAIPLPIKQIHGYTYIRTSSEYIAINLKKNVYISMSKEDFKHCTQQKETNFICKKNLPSYNLVSDRATCEAKLLSHHINKPCDVEHGSCNDTWIELHTPNSWLAICCDKCTTRTICGTDVTSYVMSSSSIVSLSPGCVLQSKDLTIYAHRQYNSRIPMHYELSIPTLESSINSIVNLTYQHVPNVLQHEETDLQIASISEKIASQKEEEARQHISISSHDINQYVISYTLLTSAVLALLVAVGRKLWRSHLAKREIQHQLSSGVNNLS